MAKPRSRSKIIQDAIDSGNPTYTTGRPCKRGHISERRVSNHICMQCAKEVYNITDRDNYRNPENTFYRQFMSRKQRAKSLGIPFTIEFDDLEKPEFCPVLGVKLNYACSTGIDGKQTRDPNKASIDKLVPAAGYVPGNVFIISWKANKLKSDMNIDELEKILEYMKRSHNGESI